MKLKAEYCKHTLNFRFDAGTSRGILKNKDSFFIKLFYQENPDVFGIGEAAPLFGLSIDFETAEGKLKEIAEDINSEKLKAVDVFNFVFFDLDYPSVKFALETAMLDLQNGGTRIIYENDFSLKKAPIAINGLVWMGNKEFMLSQLKEKIEEGFSTIKIKIGALDLEEELSLLKYIRTEYIYEDLELRLDANGAFEPSKALETIKKLSEYNIHSIEQPIKAGQWNKMANLCLKTPIPIALDEDLIGQSPEYTEVIEEIFPQFIIIKPTLLGGLANAKEWIEAAEFHDVGWWLTSALESNIGLNAISQFCFENDTTLPQGLGTGKLYENNVESPLSIKEGTIFNNVFQKWNLEHLKF
jgi:o-succinylbenzoate synthase